MKLICLCVFLEHIKTGSKSRSLKCQSRCISKSGFASFGRLLPAAIHAEKGVPAHVSPFENSIFRHMSPTHTRLSNSHHNPIGEMMYFTGINHPESQLPVHPHPHPYTPVRHAQSRTAHCKSCWSNICGWMMRSDQASQKKCKHAPTVEPAGWAITVSSTATIHWGSFTNLHWIRNGLPAHKHIILHLPAAYPSLQNLAIFFAAAAAAAVVVVVAVFAARLLLYHLILSLLRFYVFNKYLRHSNTRRIRHEGLMRLSAVTLCLYGFVLVAVRRLGSTPCVYFEGARQYTLHPTFNRSYATE